MSLSNQVIKLKSLLDTVENEVKSFESGKKASAARGRKTLQDVKKSSHELRKSIIEQLNKMKKDKPTKIKADVSDVGNETFPNRTNPNQKEPKIVKVEKPLEISPKTRKPRAKKPKISIP
jgi:hypothetical protein